MLYARALDGAGFTGRALEEYAALVPYFAGEEARCRYGELLARTGAAEQAQAEYRAIVHRVKLAGGTYRRAGPSGVGKSWLACALGYKACRENLSVFYQRVPRLFAALALARGDGRYARLLKQLARVDLLILDD